MPCGTLVDSGGEPNDQLTVAKDSGWMVQLRTGLGEAHQALDGIPECKGFCFVVGPPRAIVAANSHYLNVVFIQNDKPSCTNSLLRSPIELDVDTVALLKPSFGWKVHRLLKATQDLKTLVHNSHFLLHVLNVHRWRHHAQLWRCRARLVEFGHKELRLVLEQVND